MLRDHLCRNDFLRRFNVQETLQDVLLMTCSSCSVRLIIFRPSPHRRRRRICCNIVLYDGQLYKVFTSSPRPNTKHEYYKLMKMEQNYVCTRIPLVSVARPYIYTQYTYILYNYIRIVYHCIPLLTACTAAFSVCSSKLFIYARICTTTLLLRVDFGL